MKMEEKGWSVCAELRRRTLLLLIFHMLVFLGSILGNLRKASGEKAPARCAHGWIARDCCMTYLFVIFE